MLCVVFLLVGYVFLLKIVLMGSVMPIVKSVAPSVKVMLLRVSSKYPVTTL